MVFIFLLCCHLDVALIENTAYIGGRIAAAYARLHDKEIKGTYVSKRYVLSFTTKVLAVDSRLTPVFGAKSFTVHLTDLTCA